MYVKHGLIIKLVAIWIIFFGCKLVFFKDDLEENILEVSTQIKSEIRTDEDLYEDRSSVSTAVTIWCQTNNAFHFKHYMSVISILQILKSDTFYIFYDLLPEKDNSNQWIQLIKDKFPFVMFQQCKRCCSGNAVHLERIVEKLTFVGGGIYVNINVLLSRFHWHVKIKNGLLTRRDREVDLFMMKPVMIHNFYKSVKGGYTYFYNTTYIDEMANLSKDTPGCDVINNIESPVEGRNNFCYFIPNLNLNFSNLVNCQNSFCARIKMTAFDKERFRQNNSVPNIVHYVWYSRYTKTKISYMFYLSILSFVYIGNFSRVFIHSNANLYGRFWEKLSQNSVASNIVKVIYRRRPEMVFNQKLKVIQHIADATKADIAYKYGGIISDPDVILLKRFDDEMLKSDFMVGRDIVINEHYPEILNMGLILCKPGNEFSKRWMNSMKNFNDSNWLWNAGIVTYKILKSNSHLGRVSDHLQVIIFKLKYHPTWLSSVQSEGNNTSAHVDFKSLTFWRENTFSLHFTSPEPFIEESISKVGLLGDIERFVLHSARLI